MQRLLDVWLALDAKRRVVGIAGFGALVFTLMILARMASEPTMALLYSGLEPASAGEVIRSLEQRGIAYDIRGDAIFVEATKRDSLRMTLAAEGLPALSTKGYELLDSLSGFGTTSRMFDATYWRAKEGELARTIVASPLFRAARVHIAPPVRDPLRGDESGKASVTVTPAGQPLNTSNARALKYLVASAVAGVSPEDVSIIDGRNGTIISEESATGVSVPDGRAARLKENVRQLVEARVGRGHAIVEVAIDTTMESESVSERQLDPKSRVVISSETRENSNSAKDSGSNPVTVSSNLPSGAANGNGTSSSSQNSETREIVNYDVSETNRKIVRPPGAIRKLSVAVLVDEVPEVDPNTGATTWRSRSDEELAALQELVASAVGFNETRGDTITIKSMRFEQPGSDGVVASPSWYEKIGLDVTRLAQASILGIVAILLGALVVRPLLVRSPTQISGPGNMTSTALPAPEIQSSANAPGALVADIPETGQLIADTLHDEIGAGSALATSGMVGSSGHESTLEKLKGTTQQNKEQSVEILQGWLEESEELA